MVVILLCHSNKKNNKQKRQFETLQQLGRLYSHPHILLIHLAKVQYRNPNIAFQQFLWCHYRQLLQAAFSRIVATSLVK